MPWQRWRKSNPTCARYWLPAAAPVVLRLVALPTSTPHDALFHGVFSRPEQAAGELAAVLPAELASRLDWSTLVALDGHFVDQELSSRHSDLLYSVQLQGEQVLVYVLLEHQSSIEGRMAFRVLRYLVRIWDWWMAEHPERQDDLPVIVPVVVSHAEGGWTASRSMSELCGIDRLGLQCVASHVPQLTLLIDDVAAASDEQLRGRAMRELGKLALLLLKHARTDAELVQRLREWMELVVRVWQEPGGQAGAGDGAALRGACQQGGDGS